MFLGRLACIFLLLVFSGSEAFSQAAVAPAGRVVKPAARPARYVGVNEFGASFLMWNEEIGASHGAVSSKGYANYGGVGLGIERNWTKYRWNFGSSLTYAVGKASADGFSTDINFPDRINRSWWAAHLAIFGHYRIGKAVMIGVGLLTRYRVVDWDPSVTSVTVEPAPNLHVGGQIHLRWKVNRRLSLIQSYAPLTPQGASLWQWTGQIEL